MRSIAILLALSICGPALADEPAAMRATLVEGMVTMTPARGGGSGPLQEDDPLGQGDTIVTQPGARLEITLSSGTVLRIGESTRMTLGESLPQKKFSAKLWLGNVWAKVHKLIASETFQLETENGVAGVRGTEFRIEVEQGKEDLVRVYEGEVKVEAHDGKWAHSVKPGQELRFHKDRPPAGVAAFSATADKAHRFMQWVHERKNRFEYKNPERENREHKREPEKKKREK
jgi:ferric-dicitrate binding protein FerR (iron transport regulator)